MPVNYFPGPVRKGNGGRKARHQGLDLGVVENYGVGAVAQEAWPQVGTVRGDGFRGHMDQLGIGNPRRPRKQAVDLVPGQVFIRCDGVALAHCLRPAEQSLDRA